MNNNSFCVIMAGGLGKRFWPVSNSQCPKQFSDILNTGKSFIRQTYERMSRLFSDENIFVITRKEFTDITHEQLPELPLSNILKEPIGRNTGTCIAYAAYKIAGIDPEASMVVVPSDHFVTNDFAYIEDIGDGIDFIKQKGGLLTIGIDPTRADTEYGYIQVKAKSTSEKISEVKTFTEKPDTELAETFLQSGDFLWNAGIFIWKVKDIIKEFKAHIYDLHILFTTDSRLNTPEEQDFIDRIYGQCPNQSIDVGIMEKSSNVYVLKGDFGWSDVGTWHAFQALNKTDEHNNTSNFDNVVFMDSNNCIVNIPEGKQAIIQGVGDLIIAEQGDLLMVCHQKDEEKIKHFEKILAHRKDLLNNMTLPT